MQTIADNCEVLIKGADLRILINHRAEPENKPLTLEQLKQMVAGIMLYLLTVHRGMVREIGAGGNKGGRP